MDQLHRVIGLIRAGLPRQVRAFRQDLEPFPLEIDLEAGRKEAIQWHS